MPSSVEPLYSPMPAGKIIIDGEDHTENLFYIVGHLPIDTGLETVITRLKLRRFFDSLLLLGYSGRDISTLLNCCPQETLARLWKEQQIIALIHKTNELLLKVKVSCCSVKGKPKKKLSNHLDKLGKFDTLLKKVLRCLHTLDLGRLKDLIDEDISKLLCDFGSNETTKYSNQTLSYFVKVALEDPSFVSMEEVNVILLKTITPSTVPMALDKTHHTPQESPKLSEAALGSEEQEKRPYKTPARRNQDEDHSHSTAHDKEGRNSWSGNRNNGNNDIHSGTHDHQINHTSSPNGNVPSSQQR